MSVVKDLRRILLCIAAAVLLSLNINSFIHAGGLLPGGFSGLALLLVNLAGKFFHVTLPYGVVYILLNITPVLMSFRLIGKKFTIYSCVTIVLSSVLTGIFPYYVITYDVLLISIFGGIINGFAICLCLFARATSGGTDFISIYISEKFGIDAWDYVLVFNAVVLTIDGFIFGWDKALYSIIFQYVTIQIINTFYKRYKKNTLFIVTDHPEELTKLIYTFTGHGATDIMAVGSFDQSPRTLVYSVVGSDELKEVMKGIKRIDPTAFVNVIRTEQLNGRFIMKPND
jgi:uncharacterized membrane-anchored protein YitT (DUF2179 family)